MSESIARKIQRELRANERLAQRLDFLRARIKQQRDEDIARLRREEGLAELPETPKQRQQRWKERSAALSGGIFSTDITRHESLGKDFLRAAEHGNALRMMAHLDEWFPVNYQDSQTLETALHIAASCGSRKALRVIVGTGVCNFLLRDRQGRLASEMAYLHGNDPVMARYLGMKEKEQARKDGVSLSRRQAAEVAAPAGTRA